MSGGTRRGRLAACVGIGAAVALLGAGTTGTAIGAGGPGGAGSQVGGSTDSAGLHAVAVDVTLTGNGAPGGGGGGGTTAVSVSVPSPCYWSSLNGGYDAEGFATAYGDNESGNRARGVGAEAQYLPSAALVESKRGQDGIWYTFAATNPQESLENSPGRGWDEQVQTCMDGLRAGAPEGAGWLFVPAGQAPPAPPAPDVPLDLLLQAAQDNLTIPAPVVVANPTASGYVNLPSWLWVEDGAGPADGFVDVEITATAGGNAATVRAEPNLFTATSDTGSASCDPEQARTAWPAADGAAPCTLTPERASVGAPSGFDVDVTTGYTASWEGTVNGGVVAGGALDEVVVDGDFGLPVAEVQALVRD